VESVSSRPAAAGALLLFIGQVNRHRLRGAWFGSDGYRSLAAVFLWVSCPVRVPFCVAAFSQRLRGRSICFTLRDRVAEGQWFGDNVCLIDSPPPPFPPDPDAKSKQPNASDYLCLLRRHSVVELCRIS